MGVDLARIDAGSIEIERIVATEGSTAVRAADVNVSGTMKISDVEARGREPDRP